MDETLNPSEAYDAQSVHRWRRRLGIAALLVFVLAVLALIPPLVNINRYQRRIVSTLSASLGRPVHLDSATLHLVPFPGLTLTNFVVSEDPAFGAEPTIRANSVEVHLRLSSLWRRHVEFSRVRFIDPSVNLVRNPQGRWNLDNILVRASSIDAAPTGQQSAGSAPRFPYIEATGARVNIKLADEKMPFSLTEADFALWLPTSQQWRVRLVAKPSRTDTNIADPGTLRVEGALEHASRLEDVPVDLRASWHDAPLGEATRLMTGNDMGWRGTLHVDAVLQGHLGAAAVKSQVTVDQLRRTDFVPATLLDVTTQCTATANFANAQLQDASCTLPVDGGTPATLSSALIDFSHPLDAPLTVDAEKLPLAYVFGWLRILSPRIPATGEPAGDLSAHLARSGAPQATWTGDAQVDLAHLTPRATQPSTIQWNVAPSTAFPGCPQALVSPATAIPLHNSGSVSLASEISPCGYVLRATGNASETDLTDATRSVPQLVDTLDTVLPTSATTASSARFDITCTRTWTAGQTCTPSRPTPPARKQPHRHRG